MYAQRLTLENYKGFEKAEFEFVREDGGGHAGWHVLAGRNGAGKSSVLMAIALALRGHHFMYRLLPDFEGQLRAGADRGLIKLDVTYSEAYDQIDDSKERTYYAYPESGQLSFQLHLMRRRGSVVPIALEPGESGWRETHSPALAQPGMGWMIAAYGPQRRLQGHSTHALELMKESSGVASMITLFREDASLAEATVWLRELHIKDQRAPIAAQDLLDLLNDGLLPDGLFAKHLDDDGLLMVEQGGIELPLERLGDGYRAVAALVFDLVYRLVVAYGAAAVVFEKTDEGITINCPGVVLIDEGETHLHPSWQKKLGFWLVAHFPNIQFIVTTHSPFICQAAIHGSLIRLSPPGDSRPPTRLEGDDFWTVVNGSPNDAMLTDLFGLDQLISVESEQLRETIARLDAKEMDETLTAAEIELLEQARAKLPNRASAQLDRFRRLLEGMAEKNG